METPEVEVLKKLVILGGGYGGMKVLTGLLGLALPDDVEITLIDKNPYHSLKTEFHTIVAGTAADVDVRQVLELAVDSMAETFREQGVQLRQSLPERVPLVRADADRLMQVVLNLLSNAVKYAPRGEGWVALRLRCDGARLVIEVEDNGPGIPLDQQDMVFDRFLQVAGDDHYRPGGTGLGLPISRRIIEHFGGHLWFRSTPGQGACFVAELPVLGAADARDNNFQRNIAHEHEKDSDRR